MPSPLAWARRALLFGITRFSPRRSIYGVSVVCMGDVADPEDVLSRVSDAIDVLGSQPWRLPRFRRAFRHVLIVPAGGQLYNFHTQSCVLDARFLRQATSIRVAAMFVHEMVHARLHNRSISQLGDRLDRVERMAIRQEIDFLQLFPDTESDVRQLLDAADRVWWSADAMQARNQERLRGAGVPAWLVRVFSRFRS